MLMNAWYDILKEVMTAEIKADHDEKIGGDDFVGYGDGFIAVGCGESCL